MPVTNFKKYRKEMLMNLTNYHQFTTILLNNLQADPRVIGLVALGSMAEQGRTPDNWSDHDFFVIVKTGEQESFRQNLDWLPYTEHIVMNIRETEHGLKVMYNIPHLIEFAIFDANELHGAKANDYHILLDKGDVQGIMAQISTRSPKPNYNPQRDLLMVLSLFYVGAGRYARGEKLSAHVFIKHHLLHHLLPLLIHLLGDNPKLDNLDPFRRLEQVYPAIATQINDSLLLPPVSCALALLDVLVAQTQPHITLYPTQVIEVVRAYLKEIEAL